MIKITPSVGRIVWYHPPKREDGGRLLQPQAAIITYVHSDTLVNLAAFGSLGLPVSRCQVYLAPPNHAISREQAAAGYANWMPWQVAQAQKEAQTTSIDRQTSLDGTTTFSAPKSAKPKTATEQLDELDRFFQETFGGGVTGPVGPAIGPIEHFKAEQTKEKLRKGQITPEQIVVFFL
jgi:hypothetical protein